MNNEIKELMAMGFTEEQARRIYETGEISPEDHAIANQNAYNLAEERHGTDLANQMTFLEVDPYIKEVNADADQSVVEEDARYDGPQYGTAVPYAMNPDYDPQFTPGGGDNGELHQPPYKDSTITTNPDQYPADENGMVPAGGYEGTNQTEFVPRSQITSGQYQVSGGQQPQQGGAPQQPQPQVDDKTEYQQRLLEAQRDASSSSRDPVGQYSYQYKDYEPMGVGNRIFQSMLTYGLSYLATNGDVGASLTASMDFNNTRSDREHRYGQRQYLESRGYNPKDIDAWIKSGDPKLLVANKGSWQSAGGGYIYDTQSGEMKHARGSAPGGMGKDVDRSVDLGDRVRIYFKDGTFEDQPKGAAPGRLGSGGAGDDIKPLTGNEYSKTNRKYTTDYNTYTNVIKTTGDLIGQISKTKDADWTTGFLGTAKKTYENLFGGQTEISLLKKEYSEFVGSEILKSLPPGAASDADIRLFASLFPDDTWPREQILSWLRGREKAAKYAAAYTREEARYFNETKGKMGGAVDHMAQFSENYWSTNSESTGGNGGDGGEKQPEPPKPVITSQAVVKQGAGKDQQYILPEGVTVQGVKTRKDGTKVVLGSDGRVYVQ